MSGPSRHVRTLRRCALLVAAAALVAAARADARRGLPVQVLKPVTALPAHVANRFEDLTACRQAPDGAYFIFDRRAHSVFTAPPQLDTAQKLIEIGTEPGRVLDPTAFELGPDGTFVVADAPRGQPRIQMFTLSGSSLGGFFLKGRAVPRIVLRNLVLNGIANLEYTGRSILLSQPELGALVAEYNAAGNTVRTFGALRKTGHEADGPLHLALNSGIVAAHPDGGFWFVFLAGLPQFRKYDAAGTLMFERHIEGPELDQFIQRLPTEWKRHKVEEGELPLVLPSVYAAAADAAGNLWVSLPTGTTYVYGPDGDKRRAVQFQAAGRIAPTGLSFTPRGRLLVTPGCYAFDVRD